MTAQTLISENKSFEILFGFKEKNFNGINSIVENICFFEKNKTNKIDTDNFIEDLIKKGDADSSTLVLSQYIEDTYKDLNKIEFEDLMERLFNSLDKLFRKLLNNFYSWIDEYSDIIEKISCMEIERDPISTIKFMHEYIFANKEIYEYGIDNLKFIQKIHELFGNFFNDKMNLLKKHIDLSDDSNSLDNFVSEYENLFYRFYEKYDYYENVFYNDIYVSSGEYKNSIKDTFNIIGSL